MDEQSQAKILLVDDIPDNLTVLDAILAPHYRRAYSLDGPTALALAAEDEPPDIILLDISMPGMNGYEVCRQLKANKNTRHIPVIFVTARDEVGDEAKGFDAGAVDYITKPVSPPVVLARVRTHLKLVETLRTSEERRRFTQSAVGAFTFEWDPRDDSGYWSQELFTLFGIEPVNGQRPSRELWLSTVHPEDRDRMQHTIQQAVVKGWEMNAEWRVALPDGKLRWLLARGKPVLEEGNQVARYNGVVMDITENKQVEATLRQWADAFEFCAHGLAIGLASNGKILVCNPAYARMLGRTREELTGSRILKLYHPREHARVRECMNNSDITGRWSAETSMVRGDGSFFPVRLDLVSVRGADGKVDYRVATVQDLTLRRRDQEALAWEATTRAAIGELARDVIGAESLEQVSGLVLEAAMRLTGSKHGYVSYVASDCVSVIIPYWSHGVRQLCPAHSSRMSVNDFMGFTGRVLQGKRPLISNDLDADPRAKGTPGWHIPIKRLLSVPALMGQSLVGHLSLANADQDYTDKDIIVVERLAEIYALAVSRIRVDERLHDEEVARRSAEEANRAKSDFLATVSHEVRTPLHNILGTAQTIRRMIKRNRLTDEYRDEALSDIEAASRHLAGIIDDILEVSRIEAGRIEISPGPVGLSSIGEFLRASLGDTAQGKGLNFLINLPGELPKVRADEKRLTQILINLAGNAIKFTQQGDVTVGAARDPEKEGFVRVSVSDTGPGIPENRREKIFERFERLDASGSIPGAGLGLSICRKLLDLMGGRIWVESELGHGANFHFTIPVWES